MYLLREEFKYSYTNIAEKIGNEIILQLSHAYKKLIKKSKKIQYLLRK